jgi:hypothetical protein
VDYLQKEGGFVWTGMMNIRFHNSHSPTEPLFRMMAFSFRRGPNSRKRGSDSGSRGHFHVGEKKGLNRPNWIADLSPNGLWHVEMKRRPVLGVRL